MFAKYFKVDNKYLDTAQLRKADILIAQGKTDEARELYNMLLEAFPLNTELKQTVDLKLQEI
jgi:predicted negative regulator of RcsB-dependent stress response